MRLDELPNAVRDSAALVAAEENETLVGWKAITQQFVTGIAVPIRYMIITNAGYYEVTPDGMCVRAAVLHSF